MKIYFEDGELRDIKQLPIVPTWTIDASKECGSALPCVNSTGICKECDEQFQHCFTKCKTPCRDKAEQKRIFDRVKEGWDSDC